MKKYTTNSMLVPTVFGSRTRAPTRVRSISGLMLVVFILLLLLPATLVKADGRIAQEFGNTDELPLGTVVAIQEDQPILLELANQNNSRYLYGVVTTAGSSLAELSSGQDEQLVATNGDVSVIVSTEGGDISQGDLLTISRVSGVAKKVDSYEGGTTLGIALSEFNASSPGTQTIQTSAVDGTAGTSVTIGTMAVRLAINDYFIDQTASQSLFATVGEKLIGRPVSLVQTILAGAVMVATLLVGGFSIYSSIHSSFISLGRNPLAGHAVFNSLVYVTMISTAVIVIGGIAAYVVLLL